TFANVELDYAYTVPAVNSCILHSEIGHELCRLYPRHGFACVYRELHRKGIRVYNLRSVGDTDVSAVAKLFGGGGHKNAAGFTVHSQSYHDIGNGRTGWYSGAGDFPGRVYHLQESPSDS